MTSFFISGDLANPLYNSLTFWIQTSHESNKKKILNVPTYKTQCLKNHEKGLILLIFQTCEFSRQIWLKQKNRKCRFLALRTKLENKTFSVIFKHCVKYFLVLVSPKAWINPLQIRRDRAAKNVNLNISTSSFDGLFYTNGCSWTPDTCGTKTVMTMLSMLVEQV